MIEERFRKIRGTRSAEYMHEAVMYWAHLKMRKGLRAGVIKRGPCEVCGTAKGRIEGHHEDYSDPLRVMWLCRKHHAERHAELRRETLARMAA